MTSKARTGKAAPRVHTIPPSAPFLRTLVDALFDGRLVPGFDPAADPLALADLTLYLPTRRAARAIAPLIREKLGGTPVLLPAIRPLGDVEEDLHLLQVEAWADGLPPALPEMERQIGRAHV